MYLHPKRFIGPRKKGERWIDLQICLINMPRSNGVSMKRARFKMSVFKSTPDLEKRVEILEKQVKEILQMIGKAPPPPDEPEEEEEYCIIS